MLENYIAIWYSGYSLNIFGKPEMYVHVLHNFETTFICFTQELCSSLAFY